MNSYKSHRSQGLLCVCFCMTVIFVFIMMWAIINALPSILADKELCQIVNVTYPSENNTDPSNLVNCNCGRGCSYDWGYCIKIEVNLDDNDYLANNDVSNLINSNDCTFSERVCLENKNKSFEKARNISIPYLQKINQTLTCYDYEGNIYLFNEDKNRNLALMCSMIAIPIVTLALTLFIK